MIGGKFSILFYGVFTFPGTDSDADIDADSCTKKVTVDVNGMALRSVLNGYRTHLSRSRVQWKHF